MGTIPFPLSIKPIVTRGYGFTRGSNVLQSPVQGGLARSVLDSTFESVPFNVNLVVTRLGAQAFWDFYDGALNHGANTFPMQLDSGMGVETHQCLITSKPKSNTNDQTNWSISMTISAEKTPSQDVPFGAALQGVYGAYGEEGIFDIINQYEILATVDLV